LEELAEAEFPVADLEHARVVDDLVGIVRSWSPVGRALSRRVFQSVIQEQST
jgi:hypothetical protein